MYINHNLIIIIIDKELLEDIIKDDVIVKYGQILPPVTTSLFRLVTVGYAMPNAEFEACLQVCWGRGVIFQLSFFLFSLCFWLFDFVYVNFF